MDYTIPSSRKKEGAVEGWLRMCGGRYFSLTVLGPFCPGFILFGHSSQCRAVVPARATIHSEEREFKKNVCDSNDY